MIANKLLENLLSALGGTTQLTMMSSYLALSTTKPEKDGTNVTEPNGNGYERAVLGGANETKYMSSATYNSATNKVTIKNIREIHFPEATGDWGTIQYFAIYSAKTGGTMYYSGELTTSATPSAGTILLIKVGELELTLSAEELSA